MRTDVKIGAVLLLVVVVGAGWYYLGDDDEQKPVPVGEQQSADEPKTISQADKDAPPPIRRGRPQESADRHATPPEEPASEPEPSSPSPFQDMLGAEDQDTPTDGPQEDQEDALSGVLASRLPDEGPTPEQPGGAETESEDNVSSDNDTASDTEEPSTESRAVERPPVPRDGRTHTVGKGDTLAILAEVYYGSQRFTQYLRNANPQVSDPANLRVGTVLNVPPLTQAVLTSRTTPLPGVVKSDARPDEEAAGRSYRVRPGDTFYGIARDELGDAGRWRELLELNSEAVKGDPKNLRVGQVLLLPEPKD